MGNYFGLNTFRSAQGGVLSACLTPEVLQVFFFPLYNGSLSFDSLFGGGGRGKENGPYVFFNNIQCWTVPDRYLEVSRRPTPYFSTTSMVQYGTWGIGICMSTLGPQYLFSRFVSFSQSNPDSTGVSLYKFKSQHLLFYMRCLFRKEGPSETGHSSKRFLYNRTNISRRNGNRNRILLSFNIY